MENNFGIGKREVADILKNSGINPTTQRIEIGHLLLQEPQHLSADEILQKLNAEYEQVSQATVYNTLRLFVDRGVIRELIFSPDRIYYDSNIKPHHHFVDVESGKIFDLALDAIKAPIIPGFDAEVQDITVMIRGRLVAHAAARS